MITVYRYKGKFGDDRLPADYIPCLIGVDEQGEEAYFETVGEIEPDAIRDTKASKWISHPVRIITVRYWQDHTPPVPYPDAELASSGVELTGEAKMGYVMADELLTAGVNF
jgi:hypothetical protein